MRTNKIRDVLLSELESKRCHGNRLGPEVCSVIGTSEAKFVYTKAKLAMCA